MINTFTFFHMNPVYFLLRVLTGRPDLQCIVTGKHRRLRIVHTIAIEDSGEAIQVLRVAAYEEQWMGPSNMQSIR
jgi:hypothetical protein